MARAPRTPPPRLPPLPPAADLDEEDRAFLSRYDASRFAHPSVAVDVVVLSAEARRLVALCVRREAPPHRGRWALPGGFCGIDESLDHAARRVLADKAHLRGVFVEQLYTFGAPERDPRTRVISVAHFALVEPGRLRQAAQGDGVLVATVDAPLDDEAPGPLGGPGADGPAARPVELRADDGRRLPMAFDHAAIVALALRRLRGRLDYSPVGIELLPPAFTLRQLQDVHEAVRGRPLNKDSFRRRMLASGRLVATGEHQQDVEHRPAELYRFAGQRGGHGRSRRGARGAREE